MYRPINNRDLSSSIVSRRLTPLFTSSFSYAPSLQYRQRFNWTPLFIISFDSNSINQNNFDTFFYWIRQTSSCQKWGNWQYLLPPTLSHNKIQNSSFSPKIRVKNESGLLPPLWNSPPKAPLSKRNSKRTSYEWKSKV